MTTTTDHTGAQLRRQVTFPELLAYGLVFIGPAAAVGVFGTLDAKSHGAVPLVYLVATLVMGLTAVSYVSMSAQVPRAGSVFAYATAGIGRRVGAITGWMVMLDYLLIPSVAYLFTGIAMNSLVPGVATWIWTAGAVLITTGLNLSGVKIAARAATLVVIAETAVLLMVLVGGVVALASTGATRDWLSPLTGAGTFSTADVLAAVSVAVLSFLGFDALATFAEETTGDRRVIGRATLVCLVIAGLLFFAQTYIGSLLSTATPAQLAADPASQGTAYYDMVDAQIAGWLHTLLALAKAIGAAFSAMVGQAAASRILMDMGRSGRLPKVLTRLSPRTGVPVAGLLVAALGNVALAVWAAQRDDGLDVLVSVVDVGALVAFVLLHASVVGYFYVRRQGGTPSPVTHLVVPVVGAATLVAVLVNASHLALVVGALWFVAGVVLVGLRPERQPR